VDGGFDSDKDMQLPCCHLVHIEHLIRKPTAAIDLHTQLTIISTGVVSGFFGVFTAVRAATVLLLTTVTFWLRFGLDLVTKFWVADLEASGSAGSIFCILGAGVAGLGLASSFGSGDKRLGG